VKSAFLLACVLELAAPGQDQQRSFELVETAPVETTLDHAELRETHEVWPEMIAGARTSLDLGHFYASNKPGSRLEASVAALEQAARRGVRVRFLGDKRFAGTYPDTLARLGATLGIEVRILDLSDRTGGVLHAKYMIADQREVFVGSQNFDWRSLEHIQELGLRVVDESVARAVGDVFELDWAIASGDGQAAASIPPDPGASFPVTIGEGDVAVRLTPVFSPQGLLPDPALWDLPRIVEIIDGAERRVRVQLLSYRASGRDGKYFDVIENALRRADARGVEVEMLLADWSKSRGTIEGLQSLQALSHVTVKLSGIPQWSGGFVPFARVIHAKFLVADGRRAWLGTSNFSADYFLASRNVGFVIDGRALAAQLDGFFEDGWTSSYAQTVDPSARYEAPRVSEQ
jgi:phosphatidylserine/phosphatidylglycerophosphate/cardiolipin synthase-like enzyme